MSLKFFLFPSGAGMEMFVGSPTIEHATCNMPMWEAWITVLSCRLEIISQRGRNRLRRSKKVTFKHWGLRHTHTHIYTWLSGLAAMCCHAVWKSFPREDETGWEGRRRLHLNTEASDTHTHTHIHVTLRVGSNVLSCRLRNISLERRERLRRRKNVLSLDSVGKKDGRKVDRVFRYHLYKRNAIASTIHYSLPSRLIRFPFPHTHAFRSLLRVFYALGTVHVTSVTSHQNGI